MNPIFILFIVCVVSGAYSGQVAAAKGYNVFAWFLAGFFFSFIALIAIAGMPMKPK